MIRRSRAQAPNIFRGLLRGLPLEGHVGQGAQARFLHPHEIAADPRLRFDPKNVEGKLFLGLNKANIDHLKTSAGNPAYVAHGGDLIGFGDDRHALLCAGTRAGKGRSWVDIQLARYPGGLTTIDPKGDHARVWAEYRQRVFQLRSVVLDPFGAAGAEVEVFRRGFNPLANLAALGDDALLMRAALIADALVIPEQGGGSPHWPNSARQLLQTAITHIATHPDYEGRRHLGSVYDLIMRDLEFADTAETMSSSTAAQGAVASGAIAYFSKPDDERGSVVSTLRTHLAWLVFPAIRACLENDDLDLMDLTTGQVSLFASLPLMMMGPASGWLRMIVYLALNAFEMSDQRLAHQKQKGGLRHLLLLDEAAVLGRMQRLEAAIGQVAGLGVKLAFVFQDLNQIEDIYKTRAHSLLANAATQLFFGVQDLTTMKYLEERLGRTTIAHTSCRSVTLRCSVQEGDTGLSSSYTEHPLLTGEEATRILDRDDEQLRALALVAGLRPMLLHRAFIDKHSGIRPEAFRKGGI